MSIFSISRRNTAKPLAGQRQAGPDRSLIGSFGRPIVPDPAGQALFVHLAGRERQDRGGGMRRIGSKGDTVPAQKDHHSVECGTFVAIDKSVVAGKTERMGRGKRGQVGLSVVPLVDWPQNGRLKKTPIPNAFRPSEYRQLLGMHVDDFI